MEHKSKTGYVSGTGNPTFQFAEESCDCRHICKAVKVRLDRPGWGRTSDHLLRSFSQRNENKFLVSGYLTRPDPFFSNQEWHKILYTLIVIATQIKESILYSLLFRPSSIDYNYLMCSLFIPWSEKSSLNF